MTRALVVLLACMLIAWGSGCEKKRDAAVPVSDKIDTANPPPLASPGGPQNGGAESPPLGPPGGPQQDRP